MPGIFVKKISIEDKIKIIKDVICKEFYLHIKDLNSNNKSRDRKYVYPRQWIFYMIHKVFKLKISLKQSGYKFNKDHTTVLYSIKTIQKFVNIYDSEKECMERLKKNITLKINYDEEFKKEIEKLSTLSLYENMINRMYVDDRSKFDVVVSEIHDRLKKENDSDNNDNSNEQSKSIENKILEKLNIIENIVHAINIEHNIHSKIESNIKKNSDDTSSKTNKNEIINHTKHSTENKTLF